ncbi:ionotropic receptor 93a-like [Penaeus monodon]|uniref:ionotropic receptor 93a-like n=1 Tax=Penaeus monodon TaxID=6687 RepID=UPI0018A78BF8|nr:ionotropic receptor 93a-like [Penaeus monodon]
MRMPGLAPKWQSLYYPLAGVVWVSIVATTVLVVVVILMMNRVGDSISPGKSLDPGTTVIEVVGILIGENLYKTLPSQNSRRVLLATWLVFAFVLGSAYTGNLTAALTLPKYPPRPETLRELVRSVDKVTMEPWGRDYKAYFKDSGSDVFAKLAELMELGPALLFGLQQATQKRTAHMDSRAVLLLNIAESFTKADGTTPLYVVRESAIPGMSAWPIPHDAPFKKNLDRCIRASLEAGLYGKWESDMLEMARRESRQRQRRQQRERPQDEEEEAEGSDGGIQALTLVHMQGPLMLLLLGLLLGALAFLLEVVVFRNGNEKSLTRCCVD